MAAAFWRRAVREGPRACEARFGLGGSILFIRISQTEGLFKLLLFLEVCVCTCVCTWGVIYIC